LAACVTLFFGGLMNDPKIDFSESKKFFTP
jgi:hypothetical protein